MHVEPLGVNTQILVNALKPTDNTLFDAINGKLYEPEPIPWYVAYGEYARYVHDQ